MPQPTIMLEQPRGRFVKAGPEDVLPRVNYSTEQSRLSSGTASRGQAASKLKTDKPVARGLPRRASGQDSLGVGGGVSRAETRVQQAPRAGLSASGSDVSDSESDVIVVGQTPAQAPMRPRGPIVEGRNINNNVERRVEAMLDVNNASGLFEPENALPVERRRSGDDEPLEGSTTSEELITGPSHSDSATSRQAPKAAKSNPKSPAWKRTNQAVRNVPYALCKAPTQKERDELIERIQRNWPQAELFWPASLAPRSVKEGPVKGIKTSIQLKPRDVSNNLLQATQRLSSVTTDEHDRAHAALTKVVKERARKQKVEEKITLQDVEDAIKACSTRKEAPRRAREAELMTSPDSPTCQLRSEMAHTSMEDTIMLEAAEQVETSMQETTEPESEAVINGRKRSYDAVASTVTYETGSTTSWADSQQWIQQTFEMMLEDGKAANKRVRLSFTLV